MRYRRCGQKGLMNAGGRIKPTKNGRQHRSAVFIRRMRLLSMGRLLIPLFEYVHNACEIVVLFRHRHIAEEIGLLPCFGRLV